MSCAPWFMATCRRRQFSMLVVSALYGICAASKPLQQVQCSSLHPLRHWGRSQGRIPCQASCIDAIEIIRAGAVDEVESEESSSGEEEEVETEVLKVMLDSDDESEDDEEEEHDSEDEYPEISAEIDYDEPLSLPGGLQMGALFGVMLLSRKMDMFDGKVVRLGRFIFVTYLILYQAFLVYVRIIAKLNNDRTPITMTNPLSGIVNAQLGQKEGGGMVKDLASQFLSSKSTVLEYDLKQARGMNGSLLFNMLFMWFLHFKMSQTQPLFAQSLTGTLNLVYHPLFQVYVLGRNLERPFRSNRALPDVSPNNSRNSKDLDDTEAAMTDGDDDHESEEQLAAAEESASYTDSGESDDEE